MSVRMVTNNMIIFVMIISGLGKCKRTTQNFNNEKISITCFEKATKLVKTLFSDMKNLEKQYQRIDKSLRIMGKSAKYAFAGKWLFLYQVKKSRRPDLFKNVLKN